MYWTESKGIGGRIKQRPEDFIVEEVKDGSLEDRILATREDL